MDEETEKLLRKAKQLVNEEFRIAHSSEDGKENDIPCSQPSNRLPLGQNLRPKAQSIQDARTKLRKEWEALKNTTISPVNETITEKALDVRKKESEKNVLFGVVAYIEVKGHEKQILGLRYILKTLGATVKDSFSIEVTHVVFKDGSLETYKRAKLLNVHLVSVLWVNACRNSKTKVCERLFPVVDINDYSNSPRVFRRFMEYQLKFYEFDESTGGIIRKSSKNQQLALLDSLRNLHINNDTVKNAKSDKHDASNELITLRLSESDESGDISKNSNTSNQLQLQIARHDDIQETGISNENVNKASDNTALKRRLFAKRPIQESFTSATDGDMLISQATQKPLLVNPYGSKVNKKRTPKKKITPNDNRQKAHSKHSPSQKKIAEKKFIGRESRNEMCHGILNFHDVYKKTHQMLRPPSKYNNADHGKCPSLVSTSLHSTENKLLKQVVASLGGFHFKAKVDKTTTHVVCGEPRRTINLLKAMAHGCWVLTLDWVEKSAQSGRWLREEQYELTEFSKIVQRSRIQKQTFGDYYSLNIFDECGGIYVSENCCPPRRDIMELVVLCGGKVTSTAASAKIVVGETVETCSDCVSEMWVLDSITLGRCKTLKKYYL